MKKLFLILRFSLLFSLHFIIYPLSAAPLEPVYFKTFDSDTGLPDHSVNAIAEDPFGGIWIATWNGLARFDGKDMDNYTHIDGDSTSLGSNLVRDILPVEKGVYVAHDRGLDYLDFASGQFRHCRMIDSRKAPAGKITSRVSHILNNGSRIFALTIDGDILRLEQDRAAVTFMKLPRPADRRYGDISRFTGGRLAMLSNKGVTILSNDGDREISNTAVPLQFDPTMNIFCDSIRGAIYIGRGIGKESLAFSVIDSRGNLLPEPGLRLPPNLMRCVSFGDGSIAFATDGQGVMIGVPGEELIACNPDNSNLSGDVIYSLFSDHRGNLWCGTYRRGLSLYSPELNSYEMFNKGNSRLHHDIVTGMVRIGRRIFVALDGGGLDIFDTSTGSTVNRNSHNSGLPGDNLTGIIYDGRKIWMTVYSHGLVEYDPLADSFISYPLDETHEPGNKLWTLGEDVNGNIIVGGLRLHSYDKTSGRFREVMPGKDLDITSIVRYDDEIFVASRRSGLIILDATSLAPKGICSTAPTGCGFAIPFRSLSCIYRDSADMLWLSRDGNGFISVDLKNKGAIKEYGRADGLDDTRVGALIEDPEGNLWAGTINGLFKFVRARQRFVKISDVRLPKEYTANAASFSDGKIWLGTTSGLVAIPYSASGSQFSKLPTLFTSMDVLNEPGRVIPLYGNDTETVDLEARENFFTLHFTVPETVNPYRIQMECMLEGFDKGWRNVTDTRSATYTNVPPGKYNMKVRHSDVDGEWSTPVSLALIVHRPWYMKWWAILIWIILLVTAGGLIIMARHRYLSNFKKVREAENEKENARKLNDAKLDFLAGISHELRTPCFLISAQIEEILDRKCSTVPVNSLNGIYRSSQKLNKLISNIIDFRKMESGNLSIAPRSMDVATLLAELTPDYEYLCSQKGLVFTYKAPHGRAVAKVDPDKIEFIVTNLITNAYKYTPKDGGEVTLALDVTDKNVVIRVSDTGIGIVEEMREAIFRPFFRTERGAAENYGDGIGLAFVKHLVELHNGTVSVESEVNVGTVFTVTIPRHFDEHEESGPELPQSDTDTEPALPVKTPVKEPHPADAPKFSNPTALHSVLVVEDEDELRRLLSNAFDTDYEVTTVATAEEAMALMVKGNFDFVITDIMLPGRDGHAVIRKVREDPRNADVKVIVLSALSSDDDMIAAYEEGADMYLTKPISLKMLRHHVDHLNSETDISALLSTPAVLSRKYTLDERKFLLRCRTIIDESLTDDNFSIEMLAGKLAMSHSALYKKIKTLTGIPVIEFINEYKICKAVVLFRQGATNVQTVAEMCGFRDVKTFRETFKRKMNMPPKQYILTISNR